MVTMDRILMTGCAGCGLRSIHLAGTVATWCGAMERFCVRNIARSGEAAPFLRSCIFVESAVVDSEEIVG